VKPNAVRQTTRRLQIRAWNSDDGQTSLPDDAAVEIAAAHLFCLFRNLQLPQNALAIARSVEQRALARSAPLFTNLDDELAALADQAEEEVAKMPDGRAVAKAQGNLLLAINTDLGTVQVELSRGLLAFARAISKTASPKIAADILRDAQAINKWDNARLQQPDVEFPIGVRLQFSAEFKEASR
jgi:hypothetical protein